MQHALFANEMHQVMDDAEGGIRYFPDVLPVAQSQALFAALVEGIEWRKEQRPMYDRIVDVPRLIASMALDDAALLPQLRHAVERVREIVPAPYTHAGFNFYRDQHDSVAMHNDRLHHLCPGQPISVLSLGAEREMCIQTRDKPTRKWLLPLAPGSLLVMSHASQSTTLHGIPKSRHPVDARISVALRVRR